MTTIASNRTGGFSSNDINYSHGYQDSAEIICYDFKEQAMDLIQDHIDLWGNMDNFIVEQLTQKIYSLVNLQEKMVS